MLLGCCDSHAYQVRAACGRGIGMCGYASVPEDGRTCFLLLMASCIPVYSAVLHYGSVLLVRYN